MDMSRGDQMDVTSILSDTLTCPICVKVCCEVTAIKKCGHIFCKECITKKIIEEELPICPVCKVDLGENPLEQIKDDFVCQRSTRSQFTQRRRDLEGDKPVPANALPAKKRLKHSAADGLRRSSRQGNVIHQSLSISSMGFLKDDNEEESRNPRRRGNVRNVLSRTYEIGSASKSSRQQSHTKGKLPSEDLNGETSNCNRLDYAPNLASTSSSSTVTTTNGDERKSIIPDLNHPAEEAILEESIKIWIRDIPIWFDLVPSDKQKASCVALPPPLSTNRSRDLHVVLHINKNVDYVPAASMIRKYVAREFRLQSEDEVEIGMSGCPIPRETTLEELLGAWVRMQPWEIGSCPKQFFIDLTYTIIAN